MISFMTNNPIKVRQVVAIYDFYHKKMRRVEEGINRVAEQEYGSTIPPSEVIAINEVVEKTELALLRAVLIPRLKAVIGDDFPLDDDLALANKGLTIYNLAQSYSGN